MRHRRSFPSVSRWNGCACISMAINLISETENGCQGMFQGARASGVWFSASRRKPRRTNFSPLEVCGSVSDESSGATPELARGARALPIPISEFGIKINASCGCEREFAANQSEESSRALRAQPDDVLMIVAAKCVWRKLVFGSALKKSAKVCKQLKTIAKNLLTKVVYYLNLVSAKFGGM